MAATYLKGKGAQFNPKNPFLNQELTTEHKEAIDEEMLVVRRAERVMGRCLSLFELAERDGRGGEWVRHEIRRQMNGEDLCEAKLPPINNMAAHEVLDTLEDLQHEDRLARRTGMACSPPPAYI